MIDLFKLFGVIGLVMITSGVFVDKNKQRNIFFILGGSFLLIYSISINEMIFIILQSIFILAAVYDLIRNNKSKKKK